MEELVYFEVNNWSPGKDYPICEPFIEWLSNDLNIQFRSDEWAKENKICVLASIVDMSNNFCVTATKKWVEENCPKLLEEENSKFLRYPDEYGDVYGQFGNYFLEYEEYNFGVAWTEEDD